MTDKEKNPTLFEAIIPIIILLVLLASNVLLFEDTLGGSNQIALILASSIAALIAWKNGKTWDDIRYHIVHSIDTAMPSILILFLIGSLAGTWMISGVVPALVFYGLKIIHPSIFLFTAIIVSGVVSLVTGTSWSTIATIGIALLGIGEAMGFNPALVAGAIISGAYFGDKLSPMSDTTNLAPAMTGTDLFTHIRYMMITTTPSFILAALAFLGIGLFYHLNYVPANIEGVSSAIAGKFNISLWLLLVPASLLILIIRKVPPLPALFAATLLGGIFAIVFQPSLISELTGEPSGIIASYKAVMMAMFGPVDIPSSNPIVDELMSSGGMAGMLNTIWLIISAMVFGGSMNAGGLLNVISENIIKFAKSTGSLVATTIATSIFINFTASDQYISIVVPGKMYAPVYRKRRLKPEVLSRTLEDGGTVTSVLVPWNTCGATVSKILSIPTFSYLPFCFFNILSPIVSITIASIGYKIRYYSEGEPEEKPMEEKDRLDY